MGLSRSDCKDESVGSSGNAADNRITERFALFSKTGFVDGLEDDWTLYSLEGLDKLLIPP